MMDRWKMLWDLKGFFVELNYTTYYFPVSRVSKQSCSIAKERVYDSFQSKKKY